MLEQHLKTYPINLILTISVCTTHFPGKGMQTYQISGCSRLEKKKEIPKIERKRSLPKLSVTMGADYEYTTPRRKSSSQYKSGFS